MEKELKEHGSFPLTEDECKQITAGLTDVRGLSPQALAFVGDGIFDLVIRTRIAEDGNRPVRQMHRRKASLVNAGAQARMAELLKPMFTEEEKDIYRRGRNCHPSTVAKNQSVSDYRHATGLETLCGYLYLSGNVGRIIELIDAGLAAMETEGRKDHEG